MESTICNVCKKPFDSETSFIFRKHIGAIGSCCLDEPSFADIELLARFAGVCRRKADHPSDNRKWYLITLTSEIGHPEAVTEIKATLTRFYKSKMYKGEKYHVWEQNTQGMIHAHVMFITDGYCPSKDKLKHKWFVDVTNLKHKQFNYLTKNLLDPKHIELKQRLNLSDNLPDAIQAHHNPEEAHDAPGDG